jgi:hypothetical protein
MSQHNKTLQNNTHSKLIVDVLMANLFNAGISMLN